MAEIDNMTAMDAPNSTTTLNNNLRELDRKNRTTQSDIATINRFITNSQYSAIKYTTTVSLDWNNGNVQYIVLANGSQAFTFANPRDGGRYLIILKQPASGSAGTITWPLSVLWSGGTAPTLTSTNSKVDVVTFVYDGTNAKYYGGINKNY